MNEPVEEKIQGSLIRAHGDNSWQKRFPRYRLNRNTSYIKAGPDPDKKEGRFATTKRPSLTSTIKNRISHPLPDYA
ncbi:hypothetical protein [Endozoicomonas sp.]|uniref:hypothetical protein n=1 Tax=Endozoicomonas sp. TaxID=1892382 RepID=UPI002886CE26|nr:hypothetical protein [Endozoicomonas sp.]